MDFLPIEGLNNDGEVFDIDGGISPFEFGLENSKPGVSEDQIFCA